MALPRQTSSPGLNKLASTAAVQEAGARQTQPNAREEGVLTARLKLPGVLS